MQTPASPCRTGHSRKRAVLLCVVVLFLTACRHTTYGVDRAMILPDGAPQVSVREGEHFLMAVPIDQPMPDWPADADTLPAGSVCMNFVISADGEVGAVKSLDAPGCVPTQDATAAPFQKAVADAVSRWRFFGAALCKVDGPESACRQDNADITPVPIQVAYRFDFSMQNGRRQIRSREN